ncbi:hypothetical protein CNMCM8980_001723 [Aspergillus fumigatiaffinis]|uniref:Zn(2)-C6 fungal-type domain-containing protein n=1 Tax=Aspergillus fumigatiaffinis TaxID=340414 RepID=A0A8H4HB67_9EURO|nr:hypothetical protein CNMCM5878_001881 [Aspergillus fumigatiaffinis]KAF4239365.1 hypothetical protein CNMCM8980_001723 [Aspergillus fumigatiaffinis]KAF4240425.1 hypothetical protein CNMCM6805_004945 [Aspergillus fumigatiaffinis]
MATLQSPPSLQARRSLSPTGPKLRDSCNSCAASKIKCTKEKPRCARCAKRNVVCEYLESKRARRKQGTRTRNRDAISLITQASPPTTSSTTPSPCEAEMLATQVITHPSPKQHHPVSYADIFSWTPSLADTATATPTVLNCNFDDFLASPTLISMLGMPDTGDLAANLADFCHRKDAGHAPGVLNLAPSNASAGVETTVDPPQESSTHQISIPEAPNTESACCSMSRTLGLLTYFPTSAPASRHTTAQGSPCPGESPTIQSVVARNATIVQTLNDILHCGCSEDGYLLAILSVVILKALGCYAAIVRQLSSFDTNSPFWDAPMTMTDSLTDSHSSPSHSDQAQRVPPGGTAPLGYGGEREEQTRMAAQEILSQLHLVQRLVNTISHRFTLYGEREGNTSWAPSTVSNDNCADLPSCMEILYPFHNSLFEQIEGKVRKRLRNLSAEILDILRY